MNNHPKTTSWENSSRWYNELVGARGHYYHEHVIIPGVLRLLNLGRDSSLLDVGCGQGIMGRQLSKHQKYCGIDISNELIKEARERDQKREHIYLVADATKPVRLPEPIFTHATAILSLQNMEDPAPAIALIGKHLTANGRAVLVLNHPYFRIPRHSGWGVEPGNKRQYRWVTSYTSPLSIPITTHPGQKNSARTWSFHQPLSAYTTFLAAAGLAIERIEEWSSDKKSQGPHAKSEDRARSEIPLFMAIVARKIS